MLRGSHLNISGAFDDAILCLKRCRILFLVFIIDGDE